MIAHRIEIRRGRSGNSLRASRTVHTRGPWSQQAGRPLDLRRHNAQSNRAFVRDEDASSNTRTSWSAIMSNVGASRTSFASMPVRPATKLRDRDAGIDQRVERHRASSVNDGDLHDAVTAKGADAGRLDGPRPPSGRLRGEDSLAGGRRHRPAASAVAQARSGASSAARSGRGVPVGLGDAEDVADDGETRRRPALQKGLAAVPASSLTARAMPFCRAGRPRVSPSSATSSASPKANRHTADRIAAALLAPDRRFGRTADGRWTVAAPAGEESPPLEACRWAVVDVETTGVRAFRGDAIMEIAVVTLDGTVAFHSLVNPGIPIPQFVAGLTGIDAKLVRDAPTFDMIADQLVRVFEGCVFVAHKRAFDWAFVSTEIERATGLLLQGPRVCTVRAGAQAVARSPAPKSRYGELSFWNRDRRTSPGDGRCRSRRRNAWRRC